MVRSLAVLMDAIESIKVAKDTSFALLLEAKRRGRNRIESALTRPLSTCSF